MKDKLYSALNDFYGIYRGYVVWNNDPKVRGRIKIFVPGVYSDIYKTKPELLPWACPAMSTFGGNAPNIITTENPLLNNQTGWSSTPHAGNIQTGAQVFVFFEHGDINYPIYFAFAQPNETWLAEHPNQHVFKTDNIRIRIDENVKDERSTCKFNSYSTNMTTVAKDQLKKDCKQFNWNFDENGGNIKQLETRLDIEIEASKPEVINAVNLNIHGNVNLHIDGDWFIEHIGNKYEYHEGDTYVHHKGNYHFLQDGTSISDLTGDKMFYHKGNYTQVHTGDTDIDHFGTYDLFVEKDVHVQYHSNYTLEIGTNYTEMVGYFGKGDKNITINGEKNEMVNENYNLTVLGSYNWTIDNGFELTAVNDISFLSQEGNINLKTAGNFELLKNGMMTGKGYQNLGTKGNIQLISTFGNINLQCIEDITKADFHEKTVIIPWNPSFLTKISSMSSMYSGFSKENILLQGEGFLKDIDDLSQLDVSVVISLISSLKNLLIYDGLPVFLPTKMIIQNPNTAEPMNDNDLSWIPVFRNEPKDWRVIPDDIQWKLPGRCMGNINIETWSGDINIKTDSSLGCAGNISLYANESTGTMPGYKIGTIDIKSNANKRIYPDPRDLFFDSNFDKKLQGKLEIFSHAASDKPQLRNSILPPVLNTILQTFLQGMGEITCKAVDYDKFYDTYGLDVVSKGGLSSTDLLNKLEEIKKQPAPKMGCIKCISDYLLGLPGVQDLCYMSEKYENFGVGGLHEYCFSKFSPWEKTIVDDIHSARGVFNAESLKYESLSIGDGHAIEMGFCDRELTGPNMGGINISCYGDFNKFIGRNEHKNINNTLEDGKVTINNVHSEIYYDDKFPPILQTVTDLIATPWNSTIAQIFQFNEGNFDANVLGISIFSTILNLKGLNAEFPQNKFRIFGYDTISENAMGNLILNNHISHRYHGYDFGFTVKTCYEFLTDMSSALDKIKYEVINDNWDQHIVTFDEKINSKKGESRDFCIKAKSPYPITIDIDCYGNRTQHFETFLNTKTVTKQLHFLWDTDRINKHLAMPKLTIIDKAENCDEIGNKNLKKEDLFYIESALAPKPLMEFTSTSHIINSKSYDDYLDYEWNGQFNIGSFPIDLKLKLNTTKYLDVYDTETKDISVKSYARGVNQDIYWTSPINRKTFVLTSKSFWKDWQKNIKSSVNTIKTELIGNSDAEADNIKEMETDPIITRNTTEYIANYFTNNEYIINNANDTPDQVNHILVNNGYNTIPMSPTPPEKTNVIKFNNGYNESNSTNYYVINNGGSPLAIPPDILGNVNKLEINNGWGKTSYVMTTGGGIFDITEYSHLTKNTTTGDTEIKYVPHYIINTTTITFNNETQYSINTQNYTNLTDQLIKLDCMNYGLNIDVNYDLHVGSTYLAKVQNLYHLSVGVKNDKGEMGGHLKIDNSGNLTLTATTLMNLLNKQGITNIGSTSGMPTNIHGRVIATGVFNGDHYGWHTGVTPGMGLQASPFNMPGTPNGCQQEIINPNKATHPLLKPPDIIETPMNKFKWSTMILGYLNTQLEYIISLFK